MSVRRTVAQSSAGLMLLAALAFGPAAAFGEVPVESGPGASDGGCTPDANGEYETTLVVTPNTVEVGQQVTLNILCFPGPGHEEAQVTILDNDGNHITDLDPVKAVPGGNGVVSYQVPEETAPGKYVFLVNVDGYTNNTPPFEVIGSSTKPTDPPTQPEPDPEPSPDDPPSGDDEGQAPGEDDNDPAPGEDDEEEGGSDTDAGDGGQNPDGDDGASEDDNSSVVGGQGSDRSSGGDSQNEDSSEGDGDTNASEGQENAADQKPAPEQPPTAPGSATNDFPAATPEPTADQKQSAALAALMTSLFANGVSSGEVGTAPDEARTVIDPSADASEIEVPADGASDARGASEDGAGSDASDSDALAATGSNLLVPAGIAGLAILAGAGLKIHQIRRER